MVMFLPTFSFNAEKKILTLSYIELAVVLVLEKILSFKKYSRVLAFKSFLPFFFFLFVHVFFKY